MKSLIKLEINISKQSCLNVYDRSIRIKVTFILNISALRLQMWFKVDIDE